MDTMREEFEAACVKHAEEAGSEGCDYGFARSADDPSCYSDSHTQAAWWAWQASRTAASVCPVCKGSGEGWVMSDSGPDGHHIQVDCPECNGRGTLIGAYEAMKDQRDGSDERYIAAGGDLLFMRAERDQLKGESESLRAQLERLQLDALANFDWDAEMTATRKDAGRLDWLQREHTLHKAVEFLYVVDGYQAQRTYDGCEIGEPCRGKTLREAIDAMVRNAGALSPD